MKKQFKHKARVKTEEWSDKMNYYVKQLVADMEDMSERLVSDIEQIQEDMPESDVNFSRLEKIREKLISISEITEKIKGDM